MTDIKFRKQFTPLAGLAGSPEDGRDPSATLRQSFIDDGKDRLFQQGNDSSLVLDLTRAVAAQSVCIGHAWNLFHLGPPTFIPYVGVMLFFVLSGFVIAHTLTMKSDDPLYGIAGFAVDRTSRIFVAFLPALILVAILDCSARQAGLSIAIESNSWETFFGNALMMIGYPSSLGVGAFGSAGQFNTVAIEFHIYMFVGALYFLLLGRHRIISIAIAVLTSAVPLAHFQMTPTGDHSLFVLWLMGFASYFVARHIEINRTTTYLAGIVAVCLVTRFMVNHLSASDLDPPEYDLGQFPIMTLALFCAAIAARGSGVLGRARRLSQIIRQFAAFSFSLYLVHYTLEKIIAAVWGGWLGAIAAIVGANILAFLFYLAFERHYRSVARGAKSLLQRGGHHLVPR